MWPVWQPNGFYVKPNFEWKRTMVDEVLAAGTNPAGLPDQWYDYGCLYIKINATPDLTSTDAKFPQFGMFYIDVWLRFKSFSFGKNIGKAINQFTDVQDGNGPFDETEITPTGGGSGIPQDLTLRNLKVTNLAEIDTIEGIHLDRVEGE
jgi:hypothetical protein